MMSKKTLKLKKKIVELWGGGMAKTCKQENYFNNKKINDICL